MPDRTFLRSSDPTIHALPETWAAHPTDLAANDLYIGDIPPERIPRQWRTGLSAQNSFNNWATAQQASGLAVLDAPGGASLGLGLPPMLIPRRHAIAGANAGGQLTNLRTSTAFRLPSVFVPVDSR